MASPLVCPAALTQPAARAIQSAPLDLLVEMQEGSIGNDKIHTVCNLLYLGSASPMPVRSEVTFISTYDERSHSSAVISIVWKIRRVAAVDAKVQTHAVTRKSGQDGEQCK